MLTIFFFADMADHSFSAKSLLLQTLQSWVNLRLFTATDDDMCTFLAEPFSNCKTDAVSTDTRYVQFAKLNLAVEANGNEQIQT